MLRRSGDRPHLRPSLLPNRHERTRIINAEGGNPTHVARSFSIDIINTVILFIFDVLGCIMKNKRAPDGVDLFFFPHTASNIKEGDEAWEYQGGDDKVILRG